MPKSGPILIIDDDEDDREILAEAFRTLNVPNKLIFKEDGQQAFEFLSTSKERPFLILCDINMPRVNGVQLRSMIVGNEVLHHKSIPFIFLTTSATPDVLIKAYEMDVQGFFEKDNSFEKVKEKIKMIVEYWSHCVLPPGIIK